jgi:hypothetical protein
LRLQPKLLRPQSTEGFDGRWATLYFELLGEEGELRNIEVQLDCDKTEDVSRDHSNDNDQEYAPEPGVVDLSDWRA